MKPYDPKTIEEKYLKFWEEEKLFQATASTFSTKKQKFYALYAFPYPSASGLHVGHVEPMSALDILVRYSRMAGRNVFFPMGWDAFGLPAENYAIKTGIHPAETTKNAIDTFRRQVKRIGISYDWETELATCHPKYYRWTQWIFVQLFKAGLAYRDKGWVNWCPSCKTVLANEQVVNGECERCGTQVVQKELEQWKFRITTYQDELLKGLSEVDWPKPTKEQQENWIGKSQGALVQFKLSGSDKTLECFTTRLDTIFGVTFVVISPEKFKEFALIELVEEQHRQTVRAYLDQAFHKTEEQRKVGEKDKTGVFTHISLLHPLTKQEIPLWVADYVLAGYGTGVVMGVPAHDERDGAFAKKFNLPIVPVITEEGTLINSQEYSGMTTTDAVQTLLEKNPHVFSRKTTYKLRDWLISRQRYWGAPIPMMFCEDCAKVGRGESEHMPGWYSVPEDHLPVHLPDVPDFRPTDDGKSPLEKAPPEWLFTTCPGCGGKAKREVDTMDTFVDSSWYFLRYISRNNDTVVFDTTRAKHMLPVDFYLIGPEHIVLHLLYARFFTKFLRDQGYLTFNEPFLKMRHQGMILGPDGKKMSKSKGNVINPDEVIEKFGADTLRIYEMFMGPLDADKAWDMSSVAGVYRFLSRVYTLFQKNREMIEGKNVGTSEVLLRKLHWAIDKLTKDIPELKFNTAIAALMEFTNLWSAEVEKGVALRIEELKIVAKLLAPFAAFLSEELWTLVGEHDSIHRSFWPQADPRLLQTEEVEVVVQVNGKKRTILRLAQDKAGDTGYITDQAMKLAEVTKAVSGKTVQKTVVVPAKLINIVV